MKANDRKIHTRVMPRPVVGGTGFQPVVPGILPGTRTRDWQRKPEDFRHTK